MTDYTPTTENVRNSYAGWADVQGREDDLYKTRALEREFDRWLAAHDREVAAKASAIALYEAVEAVLVDSKRTDVRVASDLFQNGHARAYDALMEVYDRYRADELEGEL